MNYGSFFCSLFLLVMILHFVSVHSEKFLLPRCRNELVSSNGCKLDFFETLFLDQVHNFPLISIIFELKNKKKSQLGIRTHDHTRHSFKKKLVYEISQKQPNRCEMNFQGYSKNRGTFVPPCRNWLNLFLHPFFKSKFMKKMP